MNFSTPEFMLGRQRCGQWVPLITQQFRLRHVYQIMGFNLLSQSAGSFYFTLHLTTMCAPFYTSEQVDNPHPKWTELDLKDMLNTSASCVVVRIWQHSSDGADKIVSTWGVNFSGLVYIGNKIAEIQPVYFKSNAVIFYMQGGYYTSHQLINTDLRKPVPFLKNLNLIDTLTNKVIYRRIGIKSHRSEIQNSYNIEKLQRLHYLQVQIRNKAVDVQNVREKINVINGFNLSNERDSSPLDPNPPSSSTSIRYAPQLLTMNSLNKMLQEKPTRIQKKEMVKISKEIEIAKFKMRLLSQEKDKKSVIIRQLKQKYSAIVEENEERNSDLMENYHKLSRGSEKLKEYKKTIVLHRELYLNIYSQLQHRRRQLLQELLLIYPIEKVDDNKYTIHGIYLPNSDILADCSDTGFSVALGYITHILIMCSTFLQIPLRYPLTHYGSRSYITDSVSPLLPDRDRDFPLFTKGKDKAQFTYAVYLLNKNLAQLRWLGYMNTSDLRATLHNLLSLLQDQRDPRPENSPPLDKQVAERRKISFAPEKCVSLHSLASISNISDPILDCIRHENQLQRSSSPPRRPGGKKSVNKTCRDSECGRGLGEILAIPEAYLNKQISSDSFRSYMKSDKMRGLESAHDVSSCGTETPLLSSNNFHNNFIKITRGKEIEKSCDITVNVSNTTAIEQGTDALDPKTNLSLNVTKSIKIHSDSHLRKKSAENDFRIKENRRKSRSVGSYTDDESGLVLRTSFELGSEPLLTVSCDSNEKNSIESCSLPPSVEDGQQAFLEKWLENAPNLMFSSESLYPDELRSDSTGRVASHDSPLMARTDALLHTKSFKLTKTKQ